VSNPLAIDLYCGLGGWAEGLLAEGYTVIGFDIERHDYGTGGYPGHLVIQDVTTLHGSQFKDATVIVASPPCQAYSYRAMPWKRAKALPPPDNTLFETCFRIQREACEAAGRYIPLIVENVRGAQKWVGRGRANFGSYYLWGDVAMVGKRVVAGVPRFGVSVQTRSARGEACPNQRLLGTARTAEETEANSSAGRKLPGNNSADRWSDRPIQRLKDAQKIAVYSDPRRNGGKGAHLTSQRENEARKVAAKDDGLGAKMGGDWFSDPTSTCRRHGSKSKARKAASAQIAKIPFPLAQHIARCFKPETLTSKPEQSGQMEREIGK
jgi:C-5 cytosine-specific DNA methylase